MFHQSMSRHQRAKGSKVKNTLQVTILLAVVVWLLYQTKHSYERKPEYDETNYNKANKLSKGETDIRLSRKVNAGSENVIIIDHHGNNSDETTETEGTEEDQDVFSQNSEEKAKEVINDSEESREGITNSGEDENQPKQQRYVDDSAESHAEGEVNTDVTREDLRLPSQGDGDNVVQNKNQNEVDNSLDENGVSKDGVATDESTTANNQAETRENAEQGSETGETDEHSDNAVPVKEESSSSSASDDQSNKDISAGGETVESHESTGSYNSVKEATTNPRSDDASENVNLPSSKVETQVASDSQSELAGNRSIEPGTTEGGSDDENTNIPKSVEENNVVMADTNGVPVGDEGGSQADKISVGQANENGSNEAVSTDMSSEGVNVNLSGSSEEKGTVMSDVNGVPNDEEVQSQMDHVSEGVKTDNNSSEKAKANAKDEQRSADKNSGASVKGAGVSQGANAEVATNNTVEESNVLKSTDEAANFSQASENKNVELPANGEDAVVRGAQSLENSGSDGENSGKNPLEEEKSEQSGDLVANSAQNNEQNNSNLTNNETPNEAVASHEDDASNVDNTSKNVEDAATEPESKDATTSYPGNNIGLSSVNGSAEGQEGSMSSESTASSSEEDLKEPAE